MQILIFGAGAIGLAFGGFLSTRHEVTLLGRQAPLSRFRRKGLEVTGIWGNHRFSNFYFADLKTLRRKKPKYDLILVSVKSYDTSVAAEQIAQFRNSDGTILLLQNGLGNIEIFEKHFPKKDLLAGRVIFGVERSVRGIRITVSAEPTAIGEIAQLRISSRVRRIARSISESGIPCVGHKDVRSLLWKKVAYNCALNPLASLLKCHYGLLGEQAFTRMMMEQVIHEVYEVARRAGVRMSPSHAGDFIKIFYDKLLPRTYAHHPSMLQDLSRGRKSEIHALNGAISDLGKRFRILTPANTLLTALIKRLEVRSNVSKRH